MEKLMIAFSNCKLRLGKPSKLRKRAAKVARFFLGLFQLFLEFDYLDFLSNSYLYTKKAMRFSFISFLFLFVSASLFAQKTISLEESVLQQYGSFYPEHNFNFQWIPGTEEFSVLEGYTTLMKGKPKSERLSKVMTILEFNSKMGARLNYFQGLQWKDAETFFVNDNTNVYSYNIKQKKGSTIQLDEKSENIDIHVQSGGIAYTIDHNLYALCGGKNCQITKNKDPNIVSGQAIARREMGITKGTFWSPNGNFLAFYQKDETAVHDYPLLDITTTPGTLKSIKYPMAGQPSERAKVGIFNTKNKRVVYLSPRTGDESYLTNVSWTPDEQYITIAEVNRDQQKMWLQLYTATGKFVQTLFEEQASTWVEPEHPAFFISNTEFLWISERDGFNNLYHYTTTGQLKGQVTRNTFMLKEILSQDEQGNIYFTATGENPLNTVVYRLDKNFKQQLITSDDGTYSAIIHPSGNFIYTTFQNLTTPNKEEIIDGAGKVIRTMLEAPNPYADHRIGTTEINSILQHDGTELYYRMIKPSHFDASKKYPVLVYVYGGPHAQLVTNTWMGGASLWMHWMAEQGYIIFTLDNRGSAERGVKFEHAVHRQLGTLEMQDQLRGVEFLKSLAFVDENRLAVHGWSFGGFMTSTLLLRSPGVFTTGVAGGPVTDWKYYEAMYGERYMDRPQQNPKGYREASLLNYVDRLEGKLLLIHGTIDDVVVMQHNLALVQAFIKKGIQVDFFPYPMHEHNVRGKDRVHLMEKVLTYILDHNQ
jgi:dipeptidyl-peptidase-4